MAEIAKYDGLAAEDLRFRTGAARVVLYDEVESTMDAAHELAEQGTPTGTVVLAEKQTAGRGRERRQWVSPPTGVWMTVVVRGVVPEHLGVLPLRVGIVLARALDTFAGHTVSIKWPNDLFVGEKKVGGILVESRWRDRAVDWAAVGIGINLVPVDGMASAGLLPGTTRAAVVLKTLPFVLAGVLQRGELSREEMAHFAHRDLARGRMVTAPEAGMVVGIARSGALLVEVAGRMKEVVSGSLVFADRAVSSS